MIKLYVSMLLSPNSDTHHILYRITHIEADSPIRQEASCYIISRATMAVSRENQVKAATEGTPSFNSNALPFEEPYRDVVEQMR